MHDILNTEQFDIGSLHPQSKVCGFRERYNKKAPNVSQID